MEYDDLHNMILQKLLNHMNRFKETVVRTNLRLEKMSSLATRIGSSFRQIQKHVHRDDHLFSFKTLKGYRIAEMTSSSTVLATHDLKETGTLIYTLEDIVNKTARVRIKSALPEVRWCFLKSKDQPDFKLDWSDVKVLPTKPIFEPIRNKGEVQTANRIISNTILTNRSKVAQWHKIKTERQISSAWESYLTKGCVIGGKFGIPIPAPDTLGFSKGFSLKHADLNIDQENIAWFGTDCIKIPKGETITVTIQSKEQQSEFNFTALIGIKGVVHAIYCNPDTETEVKLPIPIKEIFLNNISELIKREEKDTVYFTITGRCTFKHDVDHEIIINST